MTAHAPGPACARTDAVLAIYLDGDVDCGADFEGSGFELVSGDSLRDHLLACTTCRAQLQRARRLDALLAAEAGRAVDGDELDTLAVRWFAAIDTVAVPATARRPLARRAAALALLLVLVLPFAGIGLWLAADADHGTGPLETGPHETGPKGPPTAPAATTEPIVAPLPTAEPTAGPPAASEILISDDAARRRARQPRPAVVRTDHDAPHPGQLLADVRQPATDRLAAAERLAAAARGANADAAAAFETLLDALAGLGDRDAYQRSLHRRVLDLVRHDSRLLEGLVARVQRAEARRGELDRNDLAALTVAARIGDRQLDLALQRAVRRHPPLTEPLAAALRCGARDAGAGLLLLDVWQDLTARGDLGLDDAGPCAWFADQPAAMFTELGAELARTRSEPQRVRCLLALGQGSDEPTLALLLEHLQRAPFLEAHAAAFALAHRPRRQLVPLVERARAEDMFLLRAALARAAVPAAAAWTEALALGKAERALLAHGAFPDFPRVASWFRDRALSLGD